MTRRIAARRSLILGSAALLLAACAAPARAPTAPAPPPVAAPVTAPVAAVVSPPPATPPPATTAPPVPDEPDLAAIPAPPPRSRDLIGLDATEVALRLGPPALKWREPPAEVWQYPGPACVLHVFLYGEPGAATVRHVAARPLRAAGPAPEGCYAALIAANESRKIKG